MNAQADVIALATRDLPRAAAFYTDLGCTVETDGDRAASVRIGGVSARLILRPWDDLSEQTQQPPDTSGFRGFMVSAIFDAAASVDRLLETATRAGGSSVKPAKGAVWGYAGHFADPDGHLWKVASTGFPLFERLRGGGEATDGPAMNPKELAVTLGSRDIKVTKAFYADGIGFDVDKSFGKFASFRASAGATLSLYTWDALAADADVDPQGSGFRGYVLGYDARSPKRVDEFAAAAARAGGRVLESPTERDGLGYVTFVVDPDGAVWAAMTSAD